MRNRLHVRFRRGEEIIRQPTRMNKRPPNTVLRAEHLPEGLAGGAVEGGFQWVVIDVADPFGGDETFAAVGFLTCLQESGVDGDVGIAGEVDEGDEGCGGGIVKDREDGGRSVVGWVGGDVLRCEPCGVGGCLYQYQGGPKLRLGERIECIIGGLWWVRRVMDLRIVSRRRGGSRGRQVVPRKHSDQGVLRRRQQ